MTTLDQLRNAFEVQYRQQCKIRGIKEDTIQDNTFKLFYELVYNELSVELAIVDSYADIAITPVSVYTVYNLPATFGGLRGLELYSEDGQVICEPELKQIYELPTIGELSTGAPESYAIFKSTSNQNWSLYLYPLPNFTGRARVRFKFVPAISPTASLDIATVGLVIPDIYVMIMLDGIMAQMFPDMRPVFEARLNRARLYRANPVAGHFEYQLGGYQEDE
jgi:hypothetical protein